jgi:hypothetical protein
MSPNWVTQQSLLLTGWHHPSAVASAVNITRLADTERSNRSLDCFSRHNHRFSAFAQTLPESMRSRIDRAEILASSGSPRTGSTLRPHGTASKGDALAWATPKHARGTFREPVAYGLPTFRQLNPRGGNFLKATSEARLRDYLSSSRVRSRD